MSTDKVKIQIDLAANPEAAKKLEIAFRKLGASGKKSGKSTEKGWKGADSQMQKSAKLAGMLKGAVLGIGAGLALRAVFSAIAVQEQSLAQLSASMTSTGNAAGFTRGEYLKMADAIQKNTIYSNDAAVGVEGLLLTFKKIRGPQFKETLGLVGDMSAKLGTDLQTNAIQAGKAINDPILGISQLTRVGVTFTDKQKAVIKALVDTGHAAKAQEIIIGELQSEFGGSAAKAADTFSGSIDQLKNALGDLTKGNGGGLVDAKKSVQALTKQLAAPETQKAFISFVTGIVNITNFVVKATSAFIGIGVAIDQAFKSDKEKNYLGLLAQHHRLLVRINTLYSMYGKSSKIATEGVVRYKKELGLVDKLLRKIMIPPTASKKLTAPKKLNEKKPHVKQHPVKLESAKLRSAWATLTAQTRALNNAIAGPGVQAWSAYTRAAYKASEAAGKVIAAGGNIAAAQAEAEKAMQSAAVVRDRALNAAALQQGASQRQVLAWIQKTTDELAGPAAVAQRQYTDKIAELRKLMDAGDISKTIFSAGAVAAKDRLLASTKSTTHQVSEYWKQAARNSQDALAQFLFDPFKSGLRGMIKQMADMFRQLAAQQLASNAFKFLSSWGSSTGGWIGKIAGAFSGGSAKGNVFAAGMPVPFAAGGVIGSPSLFPLRGGRMGLMGEAGPEAIMPLLRSASGHLGVRSQTSPISVRLVNVVDNAAIANAMSGSEGEKVVLNVIRNNSRSIREEIK